MLRASSEAQGKTVNLRGILSAEEGAVGVDREELLLDFAAAVIGDDPTILAGARDKLLQGLGAEALLDAAAVAGNFQRMNRIADACGIALGPMVAMVRDIRAELNIEYFNSASNADGTD